MTDNEKRTTGPATDRVTRLEQLISGHTRGEEEAEILDLFHQLSTAELNRVLHEVDVDNLFSSVDDRWLGPDHRTDLLTLLAHDRVAELDHRAQAAVIYGMQSGRTTPAMEQWIRNIFLNEHGLDLTILKNQINMRVDQHDLEGLLFLDIDDDAIREAILEHIAAQAQGISPREAKVLSDIDDTAIARIHEKRYPKGTLYPGVLALYQALDKGPSNTPRSEGDLTFVTARPGDAIGLMENHTRSALRKAGVSQMSVLTGGLANLLTKEGMADKKIENIGHYSLIFPEYDMVFIGDSGQGDVLVGQRMYAELPAGTVKAVFIHDVVDTPETAREEHRGNGIHFFDTYLGAGVTARRLELISDEGLAQIEKEVDDGLAEVEWSDTAQQDHMRELVERDRTLAGQG